MNIHKAISRAYNKRIQRGWDLTVYAIDLHGVIMKPTYQNSADSDEFYEDAIPVLKLLSESKTNKIVLWSCTYEKDLAPTIKKLKDLGITIDYINENPTSESTELCDFNKKFYFDIVLDDKGGFEPEEDWKTILNCLEHWSTIYDEAF